MRCCYSMYSLPLSSLILSAVLPLWVVCFRSGVLSTYACSSTCKDFSFNNLAILSLWVVCFRSWSFWRRTLYICSSTCKDFSYRVFIKYCVFSKILIYVPDSVFSRCQCVYTHQPGRTPALQQNWQSSEKSQHFKEKTQYLMNTL